MRRQTAFLEAGLLDELSILIGVPCDYRMLYKKVNDKGQKFLTELLPFIFLAGAVRM